MSKAKRITRNAPKLGLYLMAVTVLMLTGCRSAPNNYHTLIDPQPVLSQGQGIVVERVTLPPQVDRPQIVVRQGQSGLAILETEWWGANLVDELRSALQDQLGGTAAGRTKVILRLDVQRFDSVPGQYALLEAVWRLHRADSDEISCWTSTRTPADNTITGLVNAHQTNVRKLAQTIRTAVSKDALRCHTG